MKNMEDIEEDIAPFLNDYDKINLVKEYCSFCDLEDITEFVNNFIPADKQISVTKTMVGLRWSGYRGVIDMNDINIICIGMKKEERLANFT